MSTRGGVFADPEMIELLGEQSDLLAIADAIASVGEPTPDDDRPGRGNAARVRGDRRPLRAGDRLHWNLRRAVVVLVAIVFSAALLAGSALAVSPKLRELVGFNGSGNPRHELIVAEVIAVNYHLPAPPFAPALATVTFTAGQAGEAPGAGIPDGSVLFVSLLGKTGSYGPLIKAFGGHGRFHVTLRTPAGGIREILVGGWLNTTKGSPAANGEFWIPVISPYADE